ncbi:MULTISPECIES: glycosyltransferase family 4 protein [Okeania]|uniref:Glycosyltransferase n=1 Tax=Okeania hirsuta TaxID=1458930 RepID=A0A3N6PG92_9CYAN|nr:MULTISPECIES: glycosyltransferase family 4 protein [Okeania]NET13482.1 glycosyltransferase family 4 protein [Okeania sp. SIO1H6]NES78854.1 glycosyltransferase family 4 protein [Okeania sp. SIO1H4]NET22828.1 glycosyltransferase family 4 protein [Okeania sp. SIO1H5]NET77207.1 glycosyltransferase family 4 protein [Okeania sp. SIO1F9]NET95787.1 glycosyltransferase family 4 protein [Okeania sp. SIO1H2]
MKIAYVTTYDALNPASWSKYNGGNYGASNFISKTLINQGIIINYLGPLQKTYSWLTKSKWLFYRHLFKTDYYNWAEPIVCKNYANQVAEKLANLDTEIILSPEGATPTAYLECKQPLVIWIDTTLAELINFFPYLSNLCQETKNNIYTLEKAALERCKLLIVTSEWAVETVVKIYGIERSKIQVIPRGANIELRPNRTVEDIQNLVKSRGNKPCKLIFSGVFWQRKGGDIALEVAKKLNKLGLETELTVIGCQPISDEPLPSFVKPLGYIDKSKGNGLLRISQLISESHFLMLPTRADTNPHVLVEANAFGVPCLTTNVAGIPTVIKDEINGKIFSVDTSVDNYCEYIINYLTNYPKYEQLAMSSFNEYLYRLNWSVAGQKAKKLFMEVLNNC